LRPNNYDIYLPAGSAPNRLFGVAAVFLFTFSLALSFSPAARMHSWNVDLLWTHWLGYFTWLICFFLLSKSIQNLLPDADPMLLPVVSFLVGWGLLTIYRINIYFGLRQTAWLALSILVLWLILRERGFIEVLRRYKYLWFALGILLLGLTFLIGVYPGGFGPQLWLGFAGIFFQPSEMLKLLVVIFLSAYLADRLRVTFHFSQVLIPAFVIFAIAIAILLVQRDLGTSVLLLILFSIMLFLAAGRYWLILLSLAGLILAAYLGYHQFDVIRLRMDAWINPWLDPSGRSYQIVQSLMAFSAGGIFGRGPGLGSPRVVPVAQSDFIFSAIGEEVGLVGTVGLICLMILFVHRGFQISFRARSTYFRLLAAGITSFLAFQSILIVGGNLRVLPLTGVTLPFMSYGGSSLLVSMICVGILLKVSDTGGEDPAILEKPIPYFIVLGVAMAGFIGIILTNGWWSIIRSGDLLTRTDNPRLGINERYSPRGSILDQKGEAINRTQGVAGDYSRSYLYPPLSPVFGFDTSAYGQTGLEAALDGFLRGERGLPSSVIWWNHFIHGQPPPGLDIKTTIDMHLQQEADKLLGGRKGALVLLNAQTGEVLAMASHPNVDPNQAETMWNGWMQDAQAPLLNRATQASYPLGTMLSPFLLAQKGESFQGREPPGSMDIQYEGVNYTCGFNPKGENTWAEGIIAGCPAPSIALTSSFSREEIGKILDDFGFSSLPEFILPQAEIHLLSASPDPKSLVFGEGQLRISPLQVALAAAAISNGDHLPSPQLATAYRSPAGWVYFPEAKISKIDNPMISQVRNSLASEEFPGWGAVGRSISSQGSFSWYLGGTMPEWKGIPLSVALVLEEDAPLDARDIGSGMLLAATTPH
jgi:cell division protein FtsW (lipid II flippase)